jgi:hypothetical protein
MDREPAGARARGARAAGRAARIAAALLAAALAGCPTPTEPREPPTPTPRAGAGPLHAELAEVESEVARALADLDRANLAAVAAGAGAIHAGADRILADRPARVEPSDRTQYEGLIVQLKERALEMQRAAFDGSAIGAERSRVRISATCMRCHHLFGAAADR